MHSPVKCKLQRPPVKRPGGGIRRVNQPAELQRVSRKGGNSHSQSSLLGRHDGQTFDLMVCPESLRILVGAEVEADDAVVELCGQPGNQATSRCLSTLGGGRWGWACGEGIQFAGI